MSLRRRPPRRSPQALHRRLACLALAASAAFSSPAAHAWGGDGHRLVATLAQARLTAQARREIDRLLALEPGATLASVSTWPDENRVPGTGAWHYVNFTRDGGCRLESAIGCERGGCVVGAIERFAAVLAAPGNDEQRLEALKYLVHFVADVHQPLHAGFEDDRGGNRHQLQAFGIGTNLHALWDFGLIEHWPGGLRGLRTAVEADMYAGMNGPGAADPSSDASAASPGSSPGSSPGASPAASPGSSSAASRVAASAARWAEASCRIVSSPGFYPPGRKLDDADYAQRWAPMLSRQLGAAARRLARLLNDTLGKEPDDRAGRGDPRR